MKNKLLSAVGLSTLITTLSGCAVTNKIATNQPYNVQGQGVHQTLEELGNSIDIYMRSMQEIEASEGSVGFLPRSVERLISLRGNLGSSYKGRRNPLNERTAQIAAIEMIDLLPRHQSAWSGMVFSYPTRPYDPENPEIAKVYDTFQERQSATHRISSEIEKHLDILESSLNSLR